MKYRCLTTNGLLAAAFLLASDRADAAWLSDPQVIVSGNCAAGLSLEKELDGFANYGLLDGRADILYSAESGAWGFSDPCANSEFAYLRIVVALDDHYDIPIGNYELQVVVNGQTVISGYANELGLRHGAPFGQSFDNWRHLWIQIEPAAHYQVSVYNRSGLSQGDWIAIDKIGVYLRE